jgi:hypothetical protein
LIIINISEEQIKEAYNLYSFNELNGSITKGKSNFFGALGEIIIRDYFLSLNYKVEMVNDYNYDLIINNKKIDVKTKRTTTIPEENFNCSISSFNIKQKTEYYFFVRITEDSKTGFILGYLSKNKFFEKSTFNKKGEKDENGWIFKDDCYNVKIKDLNKFKHEVRDIIKSDK